MYDSLKVKFQSEEDKLKFLKSVDRLRKRYEDKSRKLDWIPTAFRMMPILATIGIGIHGVKKGWMKHNPHAFVGLAMLSGPASSAMGDFGYKLVSNKKKELNEKFKKDVLRLALKHGTTIAVPTGDVKVG